MRKIKKWIIGVVLVICILVTYLILHSSPSLAIRSKLFFDAHPIAAINTEIKFNEFQHNLDKEILEKEGSRIYCITAEAKDWETGNYLFNFKVTKKGFLYLAQGYGEC